MVRSLGSKYLRISSSSIRRGTVGPKNAKHLFFYVTNLRKEIQGYADFIERVTGDARELRVTLGHESLLNSYNEYQNFLSGRKKATFVRFNNLKEFSKPIPKEVWKQIIGKERMPQKGLYIIENMQIYSYLFSEILGQPSYFL